MELRDALEGAARRETCKVVLLVSEGDIFCQGIDLALLAPGSDVTALIEAIR